MLVLHSFKLQTCGEEQIEYSRIALLDPQFNPFSSHSEAFPYSSVSIQCIISLDQQIVYVSNCQMEDF